jgi:hypothetical protein
LPSKAYKLGKLCDIEVEHCVNDIIDRVKYCGTHIGLKGCAEAIVSPNLAQKRINS